MVLIIYRFRRSLSNKGCGGHVFCGIARDNIKFGILEEEDDYQGDYRYQPNPFQVFHNLALKILR